MNKTDRWLLPEGIEEVLPEQAQRLEQLRRQLLDTYESWGYDLVIPPFIEYLESLLTGTGNDLDLQTFKLTDQLTGRLMGIRADMTPQVARIDAHQLNRETPTRLCYIGTVLHTRTDGFAGSRSPLQVGAELYGHAGIESDVEVMTLMLETLALSGVDNPFVDLGHVGIYRELVKQAGLDKEQEATLFDSLQRKANTEIAAYLKEWKLDSKITDAIRALTNLNGDESVLTEAKTVLSKTSKGVLNALDELSNIAALLQQRLPEIKIHYDLAELRGYHYHTGTVFAAYVAGRGQAVALGGRYDDIGEVFGRARPATGFSTDLKTLLSLSTHKNNQVAAIYAPADNDPDLHKAIAELRQQGEKVVCALPGQKGNAKEMFCNRQLDKNASGWQVKDL
ncbi:MAG: ATP phosphoribosyltransferase regulatory subunit [Gammaproteobacteria bacterium]|nr:ATP phosphoribosyltransferase regulatory subunit [Gammaproteobacteria bacterium]MCW8986280.1 ATP phosphoribosyltransferase regulatory subunit [Gammaproteobacteria bacterium]